MLTLYRPNHSMNLFDRFFNANLLEDEDWSPTFSPRTDLVEKEGHYEVRADLPGLEEKDIQIEVEDGYLTIAGERKTEKEEKKDGQVIRSERVFGKFQRSFKLGSHVDSEKIKAEFKNGELVVTLPKSEKAQRKLISIN